MKRLMLFFQNVDQIKIILRYEYSQYGTVEKHSRQDIL